MEKKINECSVFDTIHQSLLSLIFIELAVTTERHIKNDKYPCSFNYPWY